MKLVKPRRCQHIHDVFRPKAGVLQASELGYLGAPEDDIQPDPPAEGTGMADFSAAITASE